MEVELYVQSVLQNPSHLVHTLSDCCLQVASVASLIVYPLTNQGALTSIQEATAALDLWLTQKQPQAAGAAWAALDDLEAQGPHVVPLSGMLEPAEGQGGGEASDVGSMDADSSASERSFDDVLDSFIDARLGALKQEEDTY